MHLASLFVVLAAAVQSAAAQPADSLAADSSTVGVAALAADTVAVVVAPPIAPTPLPAPSRHAFGRSGLVLALPPGWTSAPIADESRLPQLARYTVRQADPAQPLYGTVLVVERVVGLNPLDRERWRFGQSRHGYHGTRPVGPTGVPLPGSTGIETAGTGTAGATAFLQRGPAFWAVAVVAPAAVWQRHRGSVLALMTGVAVP